MPAGEGALEDDLDPGPLCREFTERLRLRGMGPGPCATAGADGERCIPEGFGICSSERADPLRRGTLGKAPFKAPAPSAREGPAMADVLPQRG
mmetsp:Transcript_33025/g.77059  ORF Transcript_33025/g.77059 Transcript_33025/m.77059 type:complete len:93 (+) Transcript_33025:127-405(+)